MGPGGVGLAPCLWAGWDSVTRRSAQSPARLKWLGTNTPRAGNAACAQRGGGSRGSGFSCPMGWGLARGPGSAGVPFQGLGGGQLAS